MSHFTSFIIAYRHITVRGSSQFKRLKIERLTVLHKSLIIALDPTRAHSLLLYPRTRTWATEFRLDYKNPSAGREVNSGDMAHVKSILSQYCNDFSVDQNHWNVNVIESDGRVHRSTED